MPQKAQQVDSNLQQFVDHFRAEKEKSHESRTNNDAVPWLRPVVGSGVTGNVWDGDLQSKDSIIDIHKAFNTDEAEQQLKDTFDAGKEPGNSADTIVTMLMISYAAQAERAFRARHQTLPRALAHYACRERGHGTYDGALMGASIEYFTCIIKQGSESS